MPLAADKTEGPSTSLLFLGIKLNSASIPTSLPAAKLAKLRSTVREFLGARVVRDKHTLKSLVGHLVRSIKVFCCMGKAFLNALFATKALMGPGQICRVNLEAHAELAWWGWLLDNWAGTSVHQFLLLSHRIIKIAESTTSTLMHQAPGVAVHGPRHAGSRFNGPPRPPYLVLHSKSYSQLSLQQQCGVPFGEINSSHVGHVQLQQYGFRTRLIFPSYFCLFLLRATLDQSKTSTKQKTKKPSQTRHTICGNNYSLCREMSAQTKQVK